MTAAPQSKATAPDCPVGGARLGDVFHEDFAATAAWQTEDLLPHSDAEWYSSITSSGYSYGKDNKNMYIPDSWNASDNTLKTNAAFRVPAHGILKMRHAYGFDGSNSIYYDGAVVEYSTDNGSSWNDIESIPGVHAANGYGGEIRSDSSTINGRHAFVDNSQGLTDSAWSLNALAGQDIKLRLRSVSDATYSSVGWFIDDIALYSCSGDYVAPATWAHAEWQWNTWGEMDATFGANEPAAFECSLDQAAWSTCTSPVVFRGLNQGIHKLRVRATDLAGNLDASPAEVTTTLDWTAPITSVLSPIKPSGKRSAVLKIKTNEPTKLIRCNIDQTNWDACGRQDTHNHLIHTIDTGLLGNGLHVIQIQAIDLADNIEDIGLVLPFFVDANPPKIRIKGSSQTQSIRPWFHFFSNEKTTYRCAVDKGHSVGCPSRWRPARKLKPGRHSIKVIATDSNGNKTSSRFVFRITA